MPTIDLNALDLVWGAEDIGLAINLNERQAYYILETGRIPARKIGRQWVTSRAALRAFFAPVLG